MVEGLNGMISLLERKVGKDWIALFLGKATPEEIKTKAAELGVPLSEKGARVLLQFINRVKEEELSEEELNSVAGGNGGNPNKPHEIVVCGSETYNV
jgi:bacteriocin-like protein